MKTLMLVVAAGAWAATPDSPRAEFEQRFAPLRDTILNTGGSFRFSEIYPKLEAIEQLAQRIGTDSPERARTLDLMSLVQSKREDYEETLRLGEACLALKSANAIPPAARILLIHRVAKSAENLHRYALAAQRYRAALDLDVSSNGVLLDDAQRLGIREHVAYVLHEDGKYAEALAVNRKMLGDAERIFGADDARLTTVLTNLAQNLYKLGQFDAAEAMLRRTLSLARRSHKDDVVDDSLFQLGVLAFERGDVDGARRWMKEHVQVAAQSKAPDRIARAEADAAELERRISKR